MTGAFELATASTTAAAVRGFAHMYQAASLRREEYGPLIVTFHGLSNPAGVVQEDLVDSLDWQCIATYTFRSAYYSHSRLAPRSWKSYGLEACRNKVWQTFGGRIFPRMHAMEERIMEDARNELRRRIAANLRSLREKPGNNWDDTVNDRRRLYGLTNEQAPYGADPRLLAAAIADKVFASKKAEHQKSVKSLLRGAWGAWTLDAIERTNLGRPREELARLVADEICASGLISVAVPYEIRYSVYVVNEKKVRMEWEDKRNLKANEIRARQARSLEVGGAAVGSEKDRQVREQGRNLLESNVGTELELNEALRVIDDHYSGLLERAKDLKLIAYVSTSELASHLGINRKVAIPRKTKATLTGRTALLSGGTRLQLHLEWTESTPSMLPYVDDTTNAQPHQAVGTLTFTADGDIEAGSGKIYERFIELYTRHEELVGTSPLTRIPDPEGGRPPEGKYDYMLGSAPAPSSDPASASSTVGHDSSATVRRDLTKSDIDEAYEKLEEARNRLAQLRARRARRRRAPQREPLPPPDDEPLPPPPDVPPEPDDESPTLLESDDEPLPPPPDDESPLYDASSGDDDVQGPPRVHPLRTHS